ncbi:MAG: NAD(P)H-hydrate dehydratase [Neisseria sp.]|nr:NAD(P)H-hydrate dehydratase [Neisseria sp.]
MPALLTCNTIRQTAPEAFRRRAPDSHKGSFGTLGIIGGAEGMSGAVVLAATAAVYGGSGKVWAGFRQNLLPVPFIESRPEIMLATAEALLERNDITAWACGCGLGVTPESAAVLETLLQRTDTPLLLDADALNLLAQSPELSAAARTYPQLIITPHPAEAARLLGCTAAEVQADRETAVRTLAERFQAVAVLKGRHTLIAAPDGSLFENTSGNPGLATAGSGDVLSGLTAALLSQNIPPVQAACASVWLHGAAADLLAAQHGETGMLAGELPPTVRSMRNQMIG